MSTIKQQLTAKILSENIKKPVGQAMLEAGYSLSSSKRPTQLTKSKTWPTLMEKYFPDSLLSKQHKKLLVKKEFIAVGDRGDRHLEPTGEIDPFAVARALDMAYKLKNKYPAEKSGGDTNVAVINVIKFGQEKKEQIEAEIVPNVAN